MAQFQSTFFEECATLKDELAQALARLRAAMSADPGADPLPDVTVAHRAAHSVKGGARAFGMDRLAAYALAYESHLKRFKEGLAPLDEDGLRAAEEGLPVLLALIAAAEMAPPGLEDESLAALGAAAPAPSAEPAGTAAGEAESDPLFGLFDDRPAPEGETVPEEADGPAQGAARRWAFSFAPDPGALARGDEPLALLRELQHLGRLELEADADRVPGLDGLAPERTYLAWRAILETSADPDAIREIFEFVADESGFALTLLEE